GVGRRLTGGLPLAGLQPGQVIVDQCADLLAHQEADHQVTHGAHTEEEVEEIPQHTEGAHRADDGEGAAQEPVGQNELLAAQDGHADLTVVHIDQRGGEGKEGDDGHHEHRASDGVAETGAESSGGQGRAGAALGPHAGAQDHQSGHGADDDGVHEHLADAPQALLHRMVGGRGGVGQRRHAGAGLIGVHAAGQAPTDGQHHGGAGKAAGGSHRRKGVLKNHRKDVRDVAAELYQNKDAADHIGQRHQGDHLLRKGGDTLDAAHQHNGHDDGKDHAHDPAGNVKGDPNRLHHRVGLHG
ncbi:DUF4179 domain-containing protein, partial [Dysosmobacter welbionis]